MQIWKMERPIPPPPRRRLAESFSLFCEYYRHAAGLGNSPFGHVHYEMMYMVETYHPRDLVLVPRGHAKTTIMSTLAPLWMLLRNPRLRIVIVSASQKLAKRISSNILSTLKLYFKHYFNLVGNSRNEFRLAENDHKDPSVSCAPLTGTQLTGTRADVIICDDAATNEMLDRRIDHRFIRDRYVALYDLFGVQTQPRIITVGTPYLFDDLYADIMAGEFGEYRILRRPIMPDEIYDQLCRKEISFEEAHKHVIWPSGFTVEKLKDRFQLPTFASQYMLQPLSTEEKVLKYRRKKHGPGTQYVRAFVAIDPAGGSGGDYSAVVGGALTKDGEIRILHTWQSNKHSPKQLAQAWWRIVQKIEADTKQRPKTILEGNSGWVLIKGYLQQVSDEAQMYIKSGYLETIKSTKNKTERVIGVLGPELEKGMLWIDPNQNELISQINNFPAVKHDDLVDACEMVVRQLVHTRRVYRIA